MNILSKNNIGYIALFFGFFLLEVLLAPWTGQPYDMQIWFDTGNWINQGINIYVPPNHIGYPPLWALWCGLSFNLYRFFGNNFEIWRFIIKLPVILSHLALAFVVGKFAEERFDQKTAKKIFVFTLTWSFFVFIGAIWGQINTLSALLTFLAFYALIQKKIGVSASFLGIATALKIYPIITLPAFIVNVFKNQNGKEAAKFAAIAIAIPILFTVFVFAALGWDIVYFLRTIFYSTPVFESDPTLIKFGCMNVWSFVSLQNIDMTLQWPFRLLWMPLLVGGTIYWLRKPKMNEAHFALSMVFFYILFMISYGWIPEQSFLDLLPFIFILILGYNPKRIYLYLLAIIQTLVYAFSVTNQNLSVFEPLLAQFSPLYVESIRSFNESNIEIIWTLRGTLGLVISICLVVFLAVLMRPSILQRVQKICNRIHRSLSRKASLS